MLWLAAILRKEVHAALRREQKTMEPKGSGKMAKSACLWFGLGLVLASMSAVAQTVTGSGTTNTVPVFTGSSAVGNSPITVSGGNVGIGTTAAPVSILSVVGSGNPTITLSGSAAAYTSILNLDAAGGGGSVIDAIGGGNFLRLQTNSVDALDIGPNSGIAVGSYAGTSPPPSQGVIISGNVGIGTTNPQAKLEVNGNLRFTADGSVQTTAWTGVLCGGDYAEAMNPVGGKKFYEPGDVLVLASHGRETVSKSQEPYSSLVAGIYATKPGVIGRRANLLKEADEVPMAMIGVVPTKVTAANGPIKLGDLLVTSSEPGYAMKGTDRSRMLGAVIGKAMGALHSGTGVIDVLVTLQ